MLFACGAYRCSALLRFRSWVSDNAGVTTRRVRLVFEDARNCCRVALDAGCGVSRTAGERVVMRCHGSGIVDAWTFRKSGC